MSDQRRRIATDQHQRAIESINELFDRLDHLIAARAQLSGIEPLAPDEDPVRDAESILELADRLNTALDDLRTAALGAAEHRRRTDLAADVGTKTNALFPRARSHSVGSSRVESPRGATTQDDPLHGRPR